MIWVLLLNVTRPTLSVFGSLLRKRCIEFTAAVIRVGLTSPAAIEPETSTSRITVALCSGSIDLDLRLRQRRRGRREREREQDQRHDRSRQLAPLLDDGSRARSGS